MSFADLRATRLRPVLGLCAALALLLQVLGAGIPAPRALPFAGVHAHHAEHQGPGKPAPDKGPHCSSCILCGKLGTAIAAPPAPGATLAPQGLCLAIASVRPFEVPTARHSAVLPVGARAPPVLD